MYLFLRGNRCSRCSLRWLLMSRRATTTGRMLAVISNQVRTRSLHALWSVRAGQSFSMPMPKMWMKDPRTSVSGSARRRGRHVYLACLHGDAVTLCSGVNVIYRRQQLHTLPAGPIIVSSTPVGRVAPAGPTSRVYYRRRCDRRAACTAAW